jgi:hypothetical protein
LGLVEAAVEHSAAGATNGSNAELVVLVAQEQLQPFLAFLLPMLVVVAVVSNGSNTSGGWWRRCWRWWPNGAISSALPTALER